MSSCCGSVGLLVLLGVALAFGRPADHVPEELKQPHTLIANVLRLMEPEIGRAPLFSHVTRSINTSCQRKVDIQVMNVTLDIYTRIFSSILKHSHNDDDGKPVLLASVPVTEKQGLQKALNKLKHNMEQLKSELGHLNQNKEDVLSELYKIDVDDPEVQKKALAEYKEIYQEAAVISHRCKPAHSSSAE
ncbi:interferon gamma 1-like [Micropterus dolomieu]|uniref:interferon gamma 1-like n=1 Tax=Micropterus dolomieu TaxID=147949 RepID=UPI001E8D11CA|nr:interferon gamma 1-like [Micropterus dolomieu]